ncbi:MAG: efflux RND transporter periplasmic adaptor subunit [Gammaproteobacteria bacterium]|nr:efflux RND transporter periplasmic adaptor subunit [Gammaproteobacteria bacterium]
MRAGWRLGGGIVGVAALALGGWVVLGGSRAAVKSTAEHSPPLELAPADVAAVERLALARRLPISGTLMPLVQTAVKAQIAGMVAAVNVREGQVVHRGDVLVRIDPRDLQAQVDAQQAALDKAGADLALARRNRDNSAALLRQHFISQSAYDTTLNTYEVDQANVKAAQAQLRLAQIALGYATVRAPIDGTVAARSINPGEMVAVDASLISLVDLSQMELQAPAPAAEIPAIHPGQLARFQVDGFGNRVFTGRVERINPVTATGSRSIMLYLAVANPDGALKGGMFSQGELVLDADAPTPAIPAAAVRNESGMPYVYLLSGSRLKRRAVTLGLRSDDLGMVEVRAGLEPGQQVVAAPIDGLKDGLAAVLAGRGATPATSTFAGSR